MTTILTEKALAYAGVFLLQAYPDYILILNQIEEERSNNGMKLYVDIYCQATYKACFELPYDMPPEKAIMFAKEHVNQIPHDRMEFVPGTAVVDTKSCRFEADGVRTKPVIRVFRGEHAFLSNFYECPVIYDGLKFRNAEAAFQAAKCTDMDGRMKFITLDASHAKRMGRQVPLRSAWDEVKRGIMREVVEAKFCNPELKRKLLATGDAVLIEGNSWGDSYWGVTKDGTGSGENHLGRILMAVRQQYREEELYG